LLLLLAADVVCPIPSAGPKAEDVAYVKEVLEKRGIADIPSNFVATAPAYSPASGRKRGSIPSSIPRNPQTVELLDMLGLEYNLDVAGQQQAQQRQYQPQHQQQQKPQQQQKAAGPAAPRAPIVAVISNPEEIALSDDGDDDGVWSGEEGEQRRQAAAAEAMQRASEVLQKAKAAAADDAEIALDEDDV
jgi:hypothetical protein